MLFLLACAPEYGLTARTEELLPSPDLGDGAAFAAWEPAVPEASPVAPVPDRRVEAFALGPTVTPVADYLFVIDESISMHRVLHKVIRGFNTLRGKRGFPNGARVAVLNTAPADLDAPGEPFPGLEPVAGNALLPGFGALVDATRIAAYKAVAPEKYAKRYTGEGCDAWFDPYANGPDGLPCLNAHTRVPLLPGRAEAGIVALRQWLESTAGEDRFRAGAAVNVIFLSDTHDPGLAEGHGRDEEIAALAKARPDIDELRALVDEPVAAFRIHAIAPASRCGESWDSPSYYELAAAAEGVEADICTTEDYVGVLDEIAKTGSRRQDNVLRLGYPAAEIGEVLLDGKPVTWSPTGDPQAIRIDGALPTNVRTVKVGYRPG